MGWGLFPLNKPILHLQLFLYTMNSFWFSDISVLAVEVMEMGIGAEEQLTGIVVEEMLDIDQQQRGVVELPDFVQEQLLGNMEEQQQLVEAEIQLAGSVTEGKLD